MNNDDTENFTNMHITHSLDVANKTSEEIKNNISNIQPINVVANFLYSRANRNNQLKFSINQIEKILNVVEGDVVIKEKSVKYIPIIEICNSAPTDHIAQQTYDSIISALDSNSDIKNIKIDNRGVRVETDQGIKCIEECLVESIKAGALILKNISLSNLNLIEYTNAINALPDAKIHGMELN